MFSLSCRLAHRIFLLCIWRRNSQYCGEINLAKSPRPGSLTPVVVAMQNTDTAYLIRTCALLLFELNSAYFWVIAALLRVIKYDVWIANHSIASFISSRTSSLAYIFYIRKHRRWAPWCLACSFSWPGRRSQICSWSCNQESGRASAWIGLLHCSSNKSMMIR
jgi:hypothetical protein